MTNLIKFITEFIIAVYTIYLSKILSRTFLVDVHMQIATCRFSLNDNYLNEQIQKWTLKFYSPYCRNSNTKQVILKSHCLEPCIIMRIRVRVNESENVCVCVWSIQVFAPHPLHKHNQVIKGQTKECSITPLAAKLQTLISTRAL